jgi:hypothetical protein
MLENVIALHPTKSEILKYDTNKHMFMQRGEIMIPIVLDMTIRTLTCNKSISDNRLAKMFNYHANNYYMGNRFKTTNVKVDSRYIQLNTEAPISNLAREMNNNKFYKSYDVYDSYLNNAAGENGNGDNNREMSLVRGKRFIPLLALELVPFQLYGRVTRILLLKIHLKNMQVILVW